MKAHKIVTRYIKMFIGGSCDMGFLCLNMRIKAKLAVYDMESKSQDSQTQRESYEENTKVVA